MKLHEAIELLLMERGRPMRARDIASELNVRGIYEKENKEPIEPSQILLRVKNYPSLFNNINGNIFLVNDWTWKKILTAYDYITQTLRDTYFGPERQTIVAVLLFYKRMIDKGRLEPDFMETNLPDDPIFIHSYKIQQLFDNLTNTYSIQPPKLLFEECARLVSRLNRDTLFRIISIVKEIDTQNLEDWEFGNIYDYLIALSLTDAHKTVFINTPYLIRQIMIGLLNVKPFTTVYDPAANIGSLLIETAKSVNGNIHAFGNEVNVWLSELAGLNISIHGLSDIRINNGDCFNEEYISQTYDYIISGLPTLSLNTENSSKYSWLFFRQNMTAPKVSRSISPLVLLILYKLSENGKAIVLIPDGWLTNTGQESEVRKYLVENDLVEAVISLPHGALRPMTEMKSSLLVINKRKEQHNHQLIHFIKAKSLDTTSKVIMLNAEEIIESYRRADTLHKHGEVINIKDLRRNYNLSAEFYDPQLLLGTSMLSEGKARLLKDLVQIKTGIRNDKLNLSELGSVPFIKTENLSKDILDLHLRIENSSRLSPTAINPMYLIEEACILIARMGENLKATIFYPSEDLPKIVTNKNIFALIPNKKHPLNIEYLFYQLHSTFILEQVNKQRIGSIMPSINLSSLKDIIIPYMSLEAQKEFVQSQKANLIVSERSRVEEKIKALGYKEETKQAESDVIRTLTHQLRPIFTGLSGVADRIKRVIELNKLDKLKEYNELNFEPDPELEDILATPDNFTIRELVDKLANDSKHLSDVLTNVDKVMNFKLLPGDLVETDFFDFLKNYKSQKEVENNVNYEIDIKGESALVYIKASTIKELLDQLLTNAESHGFKQANQNRGYRVQFVIKVNKRRQVVILEYYNNGEPYELTAEDFTTAFEKGNKSKGSGIGGNYISRIVEAHNGKLVVDEFYEKGFHLTFEFPTSKNIING